MKNILFIALILFCFLSACKQSKEKSPRAGKLILKFEHIANGNLLIPDSMIYKNAAGNQYEVTEIQWFVSDITLEKATGEKILLDSTSFAHYIDTNIPESAVWRINDSIQRGKYNSLTLTFGIKGIKNTPYFFTDHPESDMMWPINLGGDNGGYHYMKLNGFWMDSLDNRSPFNFHLGVGQEFDESGNITGFIQNWFEIKLPDSAFEIHKDESVEVTIMMNVDNWFQNPHVYDHNAHGSKIMQNQNAMNMGKENGKEDVFSVKSIKTIP